MEYETATHKYVCRFCKGSFDQQSNLQKHVQQIHTARSSSKESRLCSLCGLLCLKIDGYRKHLKHIHGHNAEGQVFTFKCFTDFNTWKKELEKRNYCKYLLLYPPKKFAQGDKQYVYQCDSSVPNPARNKKQTGAVAPRNCSSTISAIEYTKNREIKVEFWNTHSGHPVPVEDDELDAAINSLEATEVVIMSEDHIEDQYSDNSTLFLDTNEVSQSEFPFKERSKIRKKLFLNSSQSPSSNVKSFSYKKDHTKKVGSFSFSLASVACMKPTIKKKPVTTVDTNDDNPVNDSTSAVINSPVSCVEISSTDENVINSTTDLDSEKNNTVVLTSTASSSIDVPSTITDVSVSSASVVTVTTTTPSSSTATVTEASTLADLANINEGILKGKFILLRNTGKNGQENLILCPVDIPGQAQKEGSEAATNDIPSLMKSLLQLPKQDSQKENKPSEKSPGAKLSKNSNQGTKRKASSIQTKMPVAKKTKLSKANETSSPTDKDKSLLVDNESSDVIDISENSSHVNSPKSKKNTPSTPSTCIQRPPATITGSNFVPIQGMLMNQNSTISGLVPGSTFVAINNTLIPVSSDGQRFISPYSLAPNTVPLNIASPQTSSIRACNKPDIILSPFPRRAYPANMMGASPGQVIFVPQTAGSPLIQRPFYTYSRMTGPGVPIGTLQPSGSVVRTSRNPLQVGAPRLVPRPTGSPIAVRSQLLPRPATYVSSSVLPGPATYVSSPVLPRPATYVSSPVLPTPFLRPLVSGASVRPIVSTTISNAVQIQRVSHPVTTVSSLQSGMFVQNSRPVTSASIVKKPLPQAGTFLLESSDGLYMVEAVDPVPATQLSTSNQVTASTTSTPCKKLETSDLPKHVTTIEEKTDSPSNNKLNSSANLSISSPEAKFEGKKQTPRRTGGVQIQSVYQSKRPLKDDDMEIMKKIKYYQLEMKFLTSEADCKRLRLELARARAKNRENEKKLEVKEQEEKSVASSKTQEPITAAKDNLSDKTQQENSATEKVCDNLNEDNKCIKSELEIEPFTTVDVAPEAIDSPCSTGGEDPLIVDSYSIGGEDPLTVDSCSTGDEVPSTDLLCDTSVAAASAVDSLCNTVTPTPSAVDTQSNTADAKPSEADSHCSTSVEVPLVADSCESMTMIAPSDPDSHCNTSEAVSSEMSSRCSKRIDISSEHYSPKLATDSLEKLNIEDIPPEVYTMIRTSVLRNLYTDMKGLCEENKKLFEELQNYRTHDQFYKILLKGLEE